MILGLTGGIASGKSFVADSFVACGAILVSADHLAREVVNPGSPTLAKLVDAFGVDVLTPGGCLNREMMDSELPIYIEGPGISAKFVARIPFPQNFKKQNWKINGSRQVSADQQQ